jgi:hypothetical protein
MKAPLAILALAFVVSSPAQASQIECRDVLGINDLGISVLLASQEGSLTARISQSGFGGTEQAVQVPFVKVKPGKLLDPATYRAGQFILKIQTEAVPDANGGVPSWMTVKMPNGELLDLAMSCQLKS